MITLTNADPDMPPELHDRAADNWRALIAIADTAGGDWPDRARRAARILTVDGNDDTSAGVMLLEDIKIVFDERGTDRIATADLIRALVARDDRPWPEWRSSKPITPRQVAKLLGRYGISPCTVRAGEKNAKGYKIESFNETFSRYLPILSVTTSQPAATNGFSDFLSVTPNHDVTDKNPPKAAVSKGCDVVTDRNGESKSEGPYEVEI